MKKIKVEQAEGMVLAHDLTRIIPGIEKGALFQKGHIIKSSDIPLLLDIGKKHIFVLEENEDGVHENEAAHRIARAVAQDAIVISPPSEGKVNLLSPFDGVLRINEELLLELLDDPEICFSTATPDLYYKKGALLASCRIIPLMKKEAQLDALEHRFKDLFPVISVDALLPQKVGLVITGSEISEGRIKDAFGPLLADRNQELGAEIAGFSYPGDDQADIEQAIQTFFDAGCTTVQCTGGMSVDPDDCTKFAISDISDQTVVYGTSVLPGAMFMLAYYKGRPIVGLPGGVAASPLSIFDFVIPRLFAGERLTRQDFTKMAIGGLLNARR